MSEETRSPDELQQPSGSDPQSNPAPPTPGGATPSPSPEASAETPSAPVPGPEVAADPPAAPAAEAEAVTEAVASEPARDDDPPAPDPPTVVDEPATAPETAGHDEESEDPGEAEVDPASEGAPANEPTISTPEEAEAFVRSVRAVRPSVLPDVLEKGMEVRGIVKALEADDAVIDVAAGRFEVRLPKLDFVDASGKVSLAQGDGVDLVLEELGEPPTFKRLSSPIGEAIGKIAEAFAGRLPLEGAITSSIKGGFEVKLEGLRAFLPGSQATLRRSDDKSKLLGRTLPLMITKFDPSGRSIVVSRRKILEKERKNEARQTRERLAKGAVFSGRVVALQAYGAFIDIGGIQGLLHLTEISWSRLRKPDEALKVGQRVDVQVLEHDESGKKVSLSMRALQEDPWRSFGKDIQPNQVRQAKVLRIVKSGAIVELAPGVEARIAPSELAPGGQMPPEERKALVGKELKVQLVEFDPKRHRASLLVAPEGAEIDSIVSPPEVKAGAHIKGLVERAAPFGLFVRLAPGKLGLLHATESNTPPGTDLSKEFPPGTPLQVEVLEVNEEEGRIRLTRRTLIDRMKDRERQQARQNRGGPGRDGGGGGRGDRRGGRGDRSSGPLVNPAQAPKGGGFASFGDLLKSAIAKPAEPAAPVAEAPVAADPSPAEPLTEAATETVTETAAEATTTEAAKAVAEPAPEKALEAAAEAATETAASTESATTGGASEAETSEPPPEPPPEAPPST